MKRLRFESLILLVPWALALGLLALIVLSGRHA